MPKHLHCPSGQNNLIFTLSDDDRAAIEPHLVPVALDLRMSLEEPDVPIRAAYFPVRGVGSTLAVRGDGRRIETGLFGCDGMSGTAIVMGADRTPNWTFMQVPGHGVSLDAERLRELVETRPSVRLHFGRFAQAMTIQTAHTALSNGHGRLVERLARWILMCHDRVNGDDMFLTHEFLSIKMGVRRAGVTVATQALEGNGLIRAGRGIIKVLDREGLEEAAQQSYGVPEREYERLFGEASPRAVAYSSSGMSISNVAPSEGTARNVPPIRSTA